MLPRDIVRQQFKTTDLNEDSKVQFEEIYSKLLEAAGDSVPASKNQNAQTFG